MKLIGKMFLFRKTTMNVDQSNDSILGSSTSNFPMAKVEKCYNCDEEVDSCELEIHFLECQAKDVKEIVTCDICDSEFESTFLQLMKQRRS